MQKNGRERGDGTVIIVACTDPRLCPEEFLGMDHQRKSRACVVLFLLLKVEIPFFSFYFGAPSSFSVFFFFLF